ncbi:cystathionine beta-synthase [Litoribacter alkaliphilus]|uniref:Cystathionine beta-synthase n=1 Tax=Litoribacter ruber TaxID=702568 RepID=A0AAP2CJA4_9BACT|nr:cystathionine beta-synthase [Litoribacter alkaliphilus]MBS9525793.1 cystathionine beta-synthase [Litoribacter alkaliphilus]
MNKKVLNYIENVLANMPQDWLSLTTHRLDIYNEGLAKTEFLEGFEELFHHDNANKSALSELPTAFDYIRLGHPLSCIMEWGIGQVNGLKADNVISFSSRTVPVLAILRKNLMLGRDTQIYYTGALPDFFDADAIRQVYGYTFDLNPVQSLMDVPSTEETTVFIANGDNGLLSEHAGMVKMPETVDFYISDQGKLGSLLLVNGEKNESYISEIQHVRRRETISMTPVNSLIALQQLIGKPVSQDPGRNVDAQKTAIQNLVNEITATDAKPLFGSSGLSMQYAIMMGLVHDALVNQSGKGIRFIVPPNCYGGTNDQARRVEACIDNVKVLDLPVDGDNNMVQSIDRVLAQVASDDAVPYIIAEIPTNPRVEVPDLDKLRAALSQKRKTASGETAIDPVFILDQTFCPNVQFLSEDGIFSEIRAISYVSGSKFPSGGKVTAGYCVANRKAEALLEKIEKHLILCDNEATALQVELLAEQLPSMNQRIADAYKNTREYVNFIREVLPQAKINFVSEKLAEEGFTPSVFSLDLPTMGSTHEEREIYKRALNLKLISRMIGEIPNEGKYCVSYGQLKGCYWTIPATSTQGTTKEGDKDYIVRVALSGNMDLELHKRVFMDFVREEVR